jgi:hypothetical protein
VFEIFMKPAKMLDQKIRMLTCAYRISWYDMVDNGPKFSLAIYFDVKKLYNFINSRKMEAQKKPFL